VNDVKIFPCRFDIPCDVQGCIAPARWFIGRDTGTYSFLFKLCENCVKSLLQNIPNELMQYARMPEPEPEKEKAEWEEEASGETELEEDKKYICKHCGEIFETTQKLAAHIRVRHKSPKSGEE